MTILFLVHMIAISLLPVYCNGHDLDSNECLSRHAQYEFIDDTITVNAWFESFNNHLKHDQIASLPMDSTITNPNTNRQARQVINALFSKVNPEAIANRKLVSISERTFQQTLNISFPSNINTRDKIYDILMDIISGNMSVMNEYMANMEPYAHCYCGHQFGYYAGQLGDGRTISLGEYHTHNGAIWELQLKGSGRTPFSRSGDGRAVLRSSIREYLMSEYMHSLGIASCRAAMIITSDTDTVKRDIFYNGNSVAEPVAIVLRLAPNWIRFGSFELHIGKNNQYGPNFWQPIESQLHVAKSLLDHVIRYHYSEIWQHNNKSSVNIYEKWWQILLQKSMRLVMKWMSIGFVHGVLNTDNMHILGIGVDYGPFGMMEYYENDYVPNYSDDGARYAYDQQVEIFKWNIHNLAHSLDKINLLSLSVTSKYMHTYLDEIYDKYYMNEMKRKFGFIYHDNYRALKLLIDVFFGALSDSVCDMTNSFRHLNMISIHGIHQCYLMSNDKNKNQCATNHNEYETLEDKQFVQYIITQCVTVSHYNSLQKRKSMIRTHNNNNNQNKNVLFYHMNANDKIRYDTKIWTSFVGLYRRNYVNKEWHLYKQSMMDNELLNSNETIAQHMKQLNDKRLKIMNSINPKYILRNHQLQHAIELAEIGNYSFIEKLKLMIMDPFGMSNELNELNLKYNGIFDQPVQQQTCDSFQNCDLLSCSS